MTAVFPGQPTTITDSSRSYQFWGLRTSANAPSGGVQDFLAQATMKGVATVNDRVQGFTAYMLDAGGVGDKTITNMTRVGTTVTVTSTAHGLANGDKVAVYGVTHTFDQQVNGAWVVANAATNTFDITVPSLSSGTYTSGGTVTNRSMYYGYLANVVPSVARGGLTGTAAHADDVNCYAGFNSGTAKATDAFYLGRNAGIAGSEWVTGLTIDANADYGIRLNGTFVNYGLDFYAGTFTGGLMRMKNNTNVFARNGADSADVAVWKVNTSNQLEIAPGMTLVGSAAFGIDFNSGAFSTGPIRLKNNTGVYGRTAAGSADQLIWTWNTLNEFQFASSSRFNSNITVGNGVNLSFSTSTNGTKIGTGTTQKIGFWNVTPVVQPTGTPAAATDLATVITLANDLRTKLLTIGLVA